MPLLEQYESLFGRQPHMIRVLALIYADILNFHKKAVRMFKGKGNDEILAGRRENLSDIL